MAAIDNRISDILSARKTVFSSKALEDAIPSNSEGTDLSIRYPLSEQLTYKLNDYYEEDEAASSELLFDVRFTEKTDGISLVGSILKLSEAYYKIKKEKLSRVAISCYSTDFIGGITIMVSKEDPKPSWHYVGTLDFSLDNDNNTVISLYELPMIDSSSSNLVKALCLDPENLLIVLE